MSTTPRLNNLRYIDSDKLRHNVSFALERMTQSLKRQKLDEFIANIQGYPSTNHKAIDDSMSGFAILALTDLQVSVASEGFPYEETPFVVFINLLEPDVRRMINAAHAAKDLGSNAIVSFDAPPVKAYSLRAESYIKDLKLGVKGNPKAVFQKLEEIGGGFEVSVSDIKIHVNGETNTFSVTGQAKHLFDLETKPYSISKIRQMFLNPMPDSSGRWETL